MELISTKGKHMETNITSCEAILIHNLLVGLLIYYDNQLCIKHYENPVLHDRYKNIEIIYN
jgi:hypothetical protein